MSDESSSSSEPSEVNTNRSVQVPFRLRNTVQESSSSHEEAESEPSTVPFSVLVARARNGKGGYDPEAAREAVEANVKRGRAQKKHRKTKHGDNVPGGPAVLSTKVRVSRARVVVSGPPRVKARDPRFDNLSGKLDRESFDQSYAFVRDLQKREIADLEKLVASGNVKDADELDALHDDLRLRKQRLRNLEQQSREHELNKRVKARKRKVREDAHGRPVRMGRGDEKKLEMEERYNMLQEKGELDGYLSRKRKKNMQRNRKAIPISARSDAE